MPRSKNAKSAEFRPSPRGLALIAAAGAFLALGLVRDALAFLLWGGAFLLLAALGLIGIAIEGLRAARALRSGADFSASLSKNAETGLLRAWPGEALSLRRGQDRLKPFLPWMDIGLCRSWRRPSWDEAGSPGRQTEFLAAAGSSLRAPSRGAWTSDAVELRVRDAAGFFRLSLRAPGIDRFIVWPSPLTPPPASRGGSGGVQSRREESFRRSEELLDSRPYLPGDDARRINWKQMAHSEELFIRQGEPEPPPRSLCLVFLDPSIPAGLPAQDASALLDRMASLCAAWAQESARQGAQILLASPGEPVVSLDSGGSRPEAFLDRLASLPPRSGLETPRRGQALRELLAAAPGAARRVELFCLADEGIVDSWAEAAAALSCRLSYSLCGPQPRLGILSSGIAHALTRIFCEEGEDGAQAGHLAARKIAQKAKALSDAIEGGKSHAARPL